MSYHEEKFGPVPKGWVVTSIDGEPVDHVAPKTPKRRVKKPDPFPEWAKITPRDREVIMSAWGYFKREVDETPSKGEDALDQEAVIALLDQWHAGMRDQFNVQDPVFVVAYLISKDVPPDDGMLAVLHVVVLEQLGLMLALRDLQSDEPYAGPPRTLWEHRHGMNDLETRQQAVMRLLTHHKMLKEES